MFNNTPAFIHTLESMQTSYDRLLLAAKKLKDVSNHAALARLLGESDQTMKNWQVRGVPKNKLFLIEEQIGVNPKWVHTGEGNMTSGTDDPIATEIIELIPKMKPRDAGYVLDLCRHLAEEQTSIRLKANKKTG